MTTRDITTAEDLFASLKAALADRDGDESDEAWQDARRDLITEIHGWCIDESQPNSRSEGWAPSLVASPKAGLVSGVEYVGFHADGGD